jgi:aliphatic nitrilase
MANSLEVDGTAWQRLAQASVDQQMTVVLGASVLDHGRVFMAQCCFFPDVSSHARYKLEPTSFEKTLFKSGPESDVAVHDVPGVGRLGTLQCFEHLQAEIRMRLQGQYEQVHVAAWPVLAGPAPETYILSAPANLAVSQSYAIENGVWVLAPMGMLSETVSDQLAGGDAGRQAILAGAGQGYAQIFAPNGMPVGATLKPDEEGLVVAGIDLSLIAGGKLFYDPMGSARSRDLRERIAAI